MRLAYVSGNPLRLFTRRLDQSKATELPGAVGVAPLFSADSQWIGFETGSCKLNKISVEAARWFCWSEDGNIYVGVSGKGLVRIPDGGGAPETIAAPAKGDVALAFPQILPGGNPRSPGS